MSADRGEMLQSHELIKFMTKRYRGRKKLPAISLLQRLQFTSSPERHQIKVNEALMAKVEKINPENSTFITQRQFEDIMMERPSSKIWEDMVYIQNCVVVSCFVPENFIYNYNAPINQENPAAEIIYKTKSEPHENSDNSKACKICNEIGYYMSKVHKIVC